MADLWIDDSVRLRIITALAEVQYHAERARSYANQIPTVDVEEPYGLPAQVAQAIICIAGQVPVRRDLEAHLHNVSFYGRGLLTQLTPALEQISPRRQRRYNHALQQAIHHRASLGRALDFLATYLPQEATHAR